MLRSGVKLRRVLGHFATGVTVVTALDDDDAVGMTVNSFTSVSLDPPLVLFCVGRDSATGRRIVGSGAFAVNMLGRDQRELAGRFAAGRPDRFVGIEWTPGTTWSPILAGAMAFVDCRIAETLERGDHTVVIGAVADAGVAGAADPLLFFRGAYPDWPGGLP
jgi:flavin reductase (DIM6/NTAB) family NADH-FMN oxidoreductase RutF